MLDKQNLNNNDSNFEKIINDFKKSHIDLYGSFTGFLNISIKALKSGKKIYLQNKVKCVDNWSLQGKFKGISKGVFNYSCGNLTTNNLLNAINIAKKSNNLINNNLFTLDAWLVITSQTKQRANIDEITSTFHEIYIDFLDYFRNAKKHLKNFNRTYQNRFKLFERWKNNNDKFTYEHLLKWFETINHSSTKIANLNELINFLKWKQDAIKQEYNNHILILEKYKKEIRKIELKSNNSYVPTDDIIIEFFKQWEDSLIKNKFPITSSQNQASLRVLNRLKLIAIYGLRCHELIYILNWDKPVEISNNKYIKTTDRKKSYVNNIESSEVLVIPAITDPDNKNFEIVIGNGKTGQRIAFPSNKKWIYEFDLLKYKTLKDCIYYKFAKTSNYKNTFLGVTKEGNYKITNKTDRVMKKKNG